MDFGPPAPPFASDHMGMGQEVAEKCRNDGRVSRKRAYFLPRGGQVDAGPPGCAPIADLRGMLAEGHDMLLS